MIHGYLKTNEDGSIIIPKYLASKLGYVPGEEIPYEEGDNTLLLHRALNDLNRVYIEVTNFCNLGCKTCIRNVWTEKTGFMELDVFRKIIKEISTYQNVPEVFLGGFGEPLTHPEIRTMVKEAKNLGSKVQLITNGTLLSENIGKYFIEEELDLLWISVDSVISSSYEEIRKGASFKNTLENIKSFTDLKKNTNSKFPDIGIAVVAMKDNINELPDIVNFAINQNAKKVIVTNVLAHTSKLSQQKLYENLLHQSGYSELEISLPRMDITEKDTQYALGEISRNLSKNVFTGYKSLVYDCCPFVLRGSVSIRWDGKVSPCLPLLHSSPSFLGDIMRTNEAYGIGSIVDQSLSALWNNKEFKQLRKRLKNFDFSPCTMCYHDDCEIVKSNQEDCFANEAPACGGCLWAQGFIQCP